MSVPNVLSRAAIQGLLLLAATVAQAQNEATLTGVVTDAATSRPIIGAIVTVGTAPNTRTTRTDASGAFLFHPLPAGVYAVTVRRIGYEAATQRVTVAGNERLTISLNRLTALDTVRVRAARQAIYGVVATAHDLRPLANATVQIYGTSLGNVSTDSTGRFFYSIQSPGPYVIRGTHRGLESQTVSVTVRRGDGVEVALLLDSVSGPGANALEMAYRDFRERLVRRGSASAVVPRAELLAHGNGGVVVSVLTAPSYAARSLRFSDAACVFIDGQPKPGFSANAIAAAEVEAVELYAVSADRSGTLRERWPRNAPCGDTGMPRVASTARGMQSGSRMSPSDVVYWIVIWLKR